MKKTSLLFGVLAISVFLINACQHEPKVIRISPETEEDQVNNQEEGSINQEEVIAEVENEGEQITAGDDLYISITAEVHVDEEQIIVEGQSNLPEGAVLNSSAVANRWAQIPFMDRAIIEADGSFRFEFPSVTSDTEVKLSLARDSLTKEWYGNHFEKVAGPHKRATQNSEEFNVIMEFFIDGLREKPYTISVEEPIWDIPNDYGDPEIWMKVDYEITHRHIIFFGKSNLVEGSFLGGNLSTSKQIVPFSFDHTNVLPDGSFILRIPYQNLQPGLYLPIRFIPSDNYYDLPLELYGEKGEYLKGELVETDGDEQYILYEVEIEDPELEVPDEVDLTKEAEELKIQVPDNLLFDYDESILKDEAMTTLSQILSELEKLTDQTTIEINGHTDSEGSAEYNLQLSEERAQSVYEYMIEHGDVDHLLIELNGYGEEKPIASNDDAEGRAKNRRVEIVVNPSQ